jgi:hypothetical protein
MSHLHILALSLMHDLVDRGRTQDHQRADDLDVAEPLAVVQDERRLLGRAISLLAEEVAVRGRTFAQHADLFSSLLQLTNGA